jgi:uncharacterized repeat protein (TIGR03803 family)
MRIGVLASLALGVLLARSAQAQTFTVLHAFSGGSDGSQPSGLIRDPVTNNLYSVASLGGDLSCSAPLGCGIVFKVDQAGVFTVLYSFKGGEDDGQEPIGSLIEDEAGNLYGTTETGGTGCVGRGGDGCGTVFKLDTAGKETILYKFTGSGKDGDDGEFPVEGMARDTAGNLFGTAGEVLFKLDPSGTETVVHTFRDEEDGGSPMGNLVMDANDNIYGTTYGGGAGCIEEHKYHGCGLVYKMTETGVETILHNFHKGYGINPGAGVILDSTGTLWGTTTSTGGNDFRFRYGTVFKLTGTHEVVLHKFGTGGDGQTPEASLIRDDKGNLYGTTTAGGKYGKGTVFKLTESGKETILYSFCAQQGCTDGSTPSASVRRDSEGNLYGTTVWGGGTGCEGMGCGTVWKLTP